MERPRAEVKAAGDIREEEQGDDDLAIFREQREVVREKRRFAVHLRLPCGLGAAPRKRTSRKKSAETRRSGYGSGDVCGISEER